MTLPSLSRIVSAKAGRLALTIKANISSERNKNFVMTTSRKEHDNFVDYLVSPRVRGVQESSVSCNSCPSLSDGQFITISRDVT